MSCEEHRTTARREDVAIRLRDVGKRFHLYARPIDRLKQMIWKRRRFHEEIIALQGVNCEIRHGETVGVIGRNGAGKSTLLQIIAGILQPSDGRVEVNGRVAPLIELGAGFNPEFSGLDNIRIYGRLLGMDEAEITARQDAILRFADIGAHATRPVKTWSSGMYARLAFAVALHVDPDILIVDEILAVGDSLFQRKCLQRFHELRRAGCTIVIVAHDQYLVRALCDKALYLRDGREVAFGPADEVTALYQRDTGETASSEERGDSKAAGPALYRITGVELLNAHGRPVTTVNSGQDVILRMRFESLAPPRDLPEGISFVLNLHRADGLYVCGATTLMEGMAPHPPAPSGTVEVTFPALPLLSGEYVWRVAVNDAQGIQVLAEARRVCPFRVVDDFRAVGVVDLPRRWKVELHEGARHVGTKE